jgi:hypothetical protein
MAPPNIKVRGAGRAKGIPPGYLMGRVSGGTGDVELIRIADLRRTGANDATAISSAAMTVPALTVLANLTGAAAVAIGNTLSDVLDLLGVTRGSIPLRGVAGWSLLVPGTSGQVLTTLGAGQDPAWASSAAGPTTLLVNGDIPGPTFIADPLGQGVVVPPNGAAASPARVSNYLSRGTFASRPVTPLLPGGQCSAVYFATDTSVAYIWTGAAWASF